MDYHFAQFNVVWLRKPLDHPQIADFVNAIDPLHEIANHAPGFVWRLTPEGYTDALTLRPLGEDGVINFTVWESREAMAAWVYREGHGDALKRRRDWFYPPLDYSVVMWWIPAGYTPTLEEALQRLQYLRNHGPTPLAFIFRDKYTPEDAEAYMNTPGTPQVGDPRIGAEQAKRLVDNYIDAWNQTDADKRNEILAQVMTDDCKYVDPNAELDSRQALSDYIDSVLNKAPGRQIVRTSEVDVHHRVARFNWHLAKGDGTTGQECIDCVEFSRFGKIQFVMGFFGPVTATEAP